MARRALLRIDGGLEHGARLHLVDLGKRDRRRQPRKPSIGLASRSSFARASKLRASPVTRATSTISSSRVRQEFMQRRIEETDRHRQPAMISKDPTKSARWIGKSLSARRARVLLVVGQDHLAHGADAVSARRTCARCGKGRCLRRRTHGAVAHRAAYRHWCAPSGGARRSAHPISVPKSPVSSGWTIGTRAHEHLRRRAIDGDDVARLDASCPRVKSCRLPCRCEDRPRPTRTAGPCRARPRRRGWSCRRAP